MFQFLRYDQQDHQVRVPLWFVLLGACCWPVTLAIYYFTPDHPMWSNFWYMVGGDGKMYGDPQIVGYPDARRKIVRSARYPDRHHGFVASPRPVSGYEPYTDADRIRYDQEQEARRRGDA